MLLDLKNAGGSNASNHTTGLSLKGIIPDTELGYYAEYAYPSDAFDSRLEYQARFWDGRGDRKLGDEIDLVITTKLSKNSKVGFVGGYFEGKNRTRDLRRFDLYFAYKLLRVPQNSAM